MWLSFAKNKVIDERFLLHRYKSTSHAGIAGAVLMGAWIAYEALRKDVIRWDFVFIMVVMIVVKWGFMLWYRTHD
jgi:hypothetical protein